MAIQGSYPNVTFIDKYITDGNRAILSLDKFYKTLKVEDANSKDVFRIPWDDFFLRYKDQLDQIMKYYTISESMFYKPKMVSFELYGTVEIWSGLLRANNMKNTSEFHYPIIRVYSPNELMELINIFFKREKVIT